MRNVRIGDKWDWRTRGSKLEEGEEEEEEANRVRKRVRKRKRKRKQIGWKQKVTSLTNIWSEKGERNSAEAEAEAEFRGSVREAVIEEGRHL